MSLSLSKDSLFPFLQDYLNCVHFPLLKSYYSLYQIQNFLHTATLLALQTLSTTVFSTLCIVNHYGSPVGNGHHSESLS